jgi:hypothetical protein
MTEAAPVERTIIFEYQIAAIYADRTMNWFSMAHTRERARALYDEALQRMPQRPLYRVAIRWNTEKLKADLELSEMPAMGWA